MLVWILSFGACSRVSQVEVEPEAVAESEAGPAVEVPVGAEARAHVLGRRPCRWAARSRRTCRRCLPARMSAVGEGASSADSLALVCRNEVVDPMARRPSSKFGTCS